MTDEPWTAWPPECPREPEGPDWPWIVGGLVVLAMGFGFGFWLWRVVT